MSVIPNPTLLPFERTSITRVPKEDDANATTENISDEEVEGLEDVKQDRIMYLTFR